MPLKVFVSSRIRNGELTEERNLARKTIEELKLEPLMWELLPQSTSKNAEEAYLDGVQLCNAYVGIIGAEGSLGSLQEFQEAMKLDKKCLMFVKKVPERHPEADEFLGHAKKFKCAEYSDPQEFSSQLEASLLDFIARETLRRLETKSQSRENFIRNYLESYIRPVLDEVKETLNALIEKRFVELRTDAWNEISRSTFFGADSDLDQRLSRFYSRLYNLNDLRNVAIEAHKQNAISAMQEAYLETARSLNQYVVIERLLIDNFETFLKTHGDAYTGLAKPLLDQLDGPVKSITPEHWRALHVSALWLLNKIFQRGRYVLIGNGQYAASPPLEYLAAFEALRPEARRIREVLLRIYQLKI
jgi:hypothetical protein